MKNSDPGYFRIGPIVLNIPPTDIMTGKNDNAEEQVPLRARNVMQIETSQARWDGTVLWKALAHPETNDYSQWEQLQSLVAIFFASPFVEIENDHLRQIMQQKKLTGATSSMAFGLTELRIDTDPDEVFCLRVSMGLTWFNHAAYTPDFKYCDAAGLAVTSADQSQPFIDFIDSWKKQNIPQSLYPWMAVEPGTLVFHWREYTTIGIGPDATNAGATLTPPPLRSSHATASLAPVASHTATSSSLPGNIDTLVQKYAASCNVPLSLARAMFMRESGGNSKAVNDKGAQGLGQLMPATAKSLGVTDPYDPGQNIQASLTYLAQKYQRFNDWSLALAAYNAGDLPVVCYRDGISKTIHDSTGKLWTINKNQIVTGGVPPVDFAKGETYNYVKTILANAGTLPSNTSFASRNFSFVAPAAASGSSTAPTGKSTDLKALWTPTINSMLAQGWQCDHFHETAAFFFLQHEIRLTAQDFEGGGDYSLYPQQLCILMRNNLVQIPIASMQYPTYQQMGPPSVTVSLIMSSVGTRDSEQEEPEHGGLQALTGMHEQLKDQFIRLRTQWRAISSIHRMQAVFVDNQVLNLLGIGGLMLRQIGTQTLAESSDLVQVEVTAARFENIFEETTAYRLNGVTSAIRNAVASQLTGDGYSAGQIKQNLQLFPNLSALAKGYQNNDLGPLADALGWYYQNGPSVDLLGYVKTIGDMTLTNAANCKAQAAAMLNAPAALSPYVAQLASGSISVVAYQTLATLATSTIAAGQYGPMVVSGSALPSGVALPSADQMAAISQKAYSILIPLLGTTPRYAREMNLLAQSPGFSQQVASNLPLPSQDPNNASHGAYADLGLKTISVGGIDQNPGSFFVDHAAAALSNMQTAADAAFKSMTAGMDATGSSAVVNSNYMATTGMPDPTAAILMKRLSPAPYGMQCAYPTYKLFLMEDDNQGLFYAFDNFYSYSSVLKWEIIRYHDKPDMALITLTNYSHQLSNKLFDGTKLGKREKKWQYGREMFGASSTGEPIAGPDGAIVSASKGVSGSYLDDRNAGEGFGPDFQRVPLQYVPLQTGTKLQIRGGYSNDPDKLTPCFIGQVTEIEPLQGDQVLRIWAQSYVTELCTEAPDKTGTYGGMLHLSDPGTAAFVMTEMLQSPMSKHFGHWQIKTEADPYTKGFNWEAVTQAVAQASGSTGFVANLAASADRSAENICINQVNSFDGTTTARKGNATSSMNRSAGDEKKGIIVPPYYRIPDNSSVTPWQVLRDIGRRYPEYNLCAKHYGHPYEANATMVFAHPLDWYYSRTALPGDLDVVRSKDPATSSLFNTWWSASGKASFAKMLDAMPEVEPFQNASNDIHGLDNTSLLAKAGQGPEQFSSVLQQLDPNGIDRLNYTVLGTLFTGVQARQSAVQAMMKQWQAQLAATPASSTSRIKSVRMHHVADFTNIIKNEITLNEKIYNAVRINHQVVKVNTSIQDHHTRILDVNGAIIDPEANANGNLVWAYAQSFLREEVGKMYRGELLLRFDPNIEPLDIVIICDASTGMFGVIEAETVIHSMDMENGATTLVKPRAITLINELTSANLMRFLTVLVGQSNLRLSSLVSPSNLSSGSMVGYGLQAGIWAGALAAAALMGGVAPLMVAVFGALRLTSTFMEDNQSLDAMAIVPLMRWGRPWVGGLEGYKLSDLGFVLGQEWQQFLIDEVQPLIEGYRSLQGYEIDNGS